MPKIKIQPFTCTSCGTNYSKWMGKCLQCGEWNSIIETKIEPIRKNIEIKAYPLESVKSENYTRIQTSLTEFNLVCGGGIVPGSAILIGGEPGIGKSTLALQVAHSFKTLYISGEESPSQIKQRAERLQIKMKNIFIASNTIVEDIISLVNKNKPQLIFIDSIQTIASLEIAGSRGSVSQIRESTVKLVNLAKTLSIPLFIIGHITKDGNIAGPKILEHIVDTVLYFEGDFYRDYRLLRTFKNRFGSINEVGLFQMTANGLKEITDKTNIFLNPFDSNAPGNTISSTLEGSRTILFEIQALVTASAFSNPRRMADGLDLNRLILMIAVLEKHAGIKLSIFDIFVNIAGGLRINKTSADLALAIAIVSSLKEIPIPQNTLFLGEISLSGEIRPVSRGIQCMQEALRSGINKIIVSKKNADEAKKYKFNADIISVKNISEVLEIVF